MKKVIYQIKFKEDWGKGVTQTDEMFFENYKDLNEFLSKAGYEKLDRTNGLKILESWDKEWGYLVDVFERELK
jgi:hypothetical protein